MIDMPAVITEKGDIRFHAKEGVRIPISFQNEDGTPRDMTVEGTSVKFYVEGFPTIALTAGIRRLNSPRRQFHAVVLVAVNGG